MADKAINWTGKAVTDKLRAAQIVGVNQTMGACVAGAKASHPWQNQTGILEGGIGIVDYAEPDGDAVKGSWGVQDIEYALIQELGGTIHHPGGTPYYMMAGGLAVFVSLNSSIAQYLPRTKPHDITLPARPYLRPQADIQYPKLAGRVRKAYESKGAAND